LSISANNFTLHFSLLILQFSIADFLMRQIEKAKMRTANRKMDQAVGASFGSARFVCQAPQLDGYPRVNKNCTPSGLPRSAARLVGQPVTPPFGASPTVGQSFFADSFW
jgi:hypothetical protein